MRIRTIILAFLVTASAGMVAFRSYDEETKNEILIKLIMQGLSSSHYSPYQVNDELSEKVFDMYLKRMDYNKRYFTQQDVASLEKYRKSIDEDIENGEYKFFEAVDEVYQRRMAEVVDIYKQFLIQPFDYSRDDELEMDPDDMEWPTSEADLKDRWRRVLKYQVVSRINNEMDMQEEAMENGTLEGEAKTFDQFEEEARAKVMKNYDDWKRRVEKQDENDRRSIYLNSILAIYDPHTGFYPPKDKENFDITMSGKLEGIGATLQESEGYVKVMAIVPGSASYRQGELEEGDFILKVGQGKDEPVDIVDMKLDDAVKLIRGPKGSEVRLTVKKVDGTVKVIPIIRDVVILEATFAKSAVIRNRHVQDGIGYIKLPKFYADFQNKGGRSCAEDVEKEIAKLKEAGVKGIVLDLRDNGGGSLYDVVQMAGLFIEKGPIVQIKGRYGQPQILEDRDSRVQWDGPLVVMVNSGSASASEIMAAAIQDYKRGIIVGTPTFGKGTVQRFYDLDKFLGGGSDAIKPLGAIKLTTQKFYRVNGGATQLKGVTPDVILPDAFLYIDRGESEQDYYMPWDEIKPADYESAYAISNQTYSTVRRNSRDRVAAHPIFTLVKENAERMKRIRDVKSRSLKFDSYRSTEQANKVEAEKYKNIQKPIDGTEVITLEEDMAEIQEDSVRVKMNQEWLDKLQKDIYVDEAIAVMGDLMN